MWRIHICISNYINVTSVSYGLLVFCSFEFWKQTILTLWIINDFSPGFLNSLSPTFYIQIQNRWGENVKYISFNKLISFLATFTLCVCHIASATKHLFPMHLLTVYLPLHHTPHQPPKQFFCLTLSLQTCFFATYGRYFSHLVDTSCSSVRYFQLWWQLLPTTMDCTCRQLYLRWADSYLYVGCIMPGLGKKGWPSQVWYFLNSSQYCISVHILQAWPCFVWDAL